MLIPKTSKMRTTKSKSLFLSKSFKILKNAREINNIPNNRNNSIQLEKNSKLSFNNENTKRKMNLTNSIPFTKQKSLIIKNELKLPFLYSKDKKKKKEINIPLDEQRIINYQKMKKYRIKLVKASKAKNEVDNVYELFKDNGLQFLFPSKKKNLFQNNINNININNMKNINNMQNMNNIQNNRNNLDIIKNLNNKNQNIPNMNINIMPNMNSIPNMNNNYNPMMKFENNEQGIPQNQMINDINEFQKNNPNLKKMNFEDLMKNANNNFEKEKKSEPYDINMILNKKGDKEDSEENDK